MTNTQTAVAIFHSHEKAEEAVRELQKSGVDIKNWLRCGHWRTRRSSHELFIRDVSIDWR